MNAAEAMVVEAAVRANDVLLMEAFMFRCSPLCAKLVEIVESGALGELRLIEAVFSFQAGFDPESRIFSNALEGRRDQPDRVGASGAEAGGNPGGVRRLALWH